MAGDCGLRRAGPRTAGVVRLGTSEELPKLITCTRTANSPWSWRWPLAPGTPSLARTASSCGGGGAWRVRRGAGDPLLGRREAPVRALQSPDDGARWSRGTSGSWPRPHGGRRGAAPRRPGGGEGWC